MQVLRVPPYPLTTTWTLPIANYEYVVYVEDLVDHSVQETVMVSDVNGKIEYELPRTQVEYDRKFLIRFYDSEHEHILLEDNLDVIRPYVNPYTYGGSTASEIAEYERLELYARAIIDSHIVDGFYNEKHIVQGVGQGTDYYSIWEPVNRVLKVYENNILVYDIDTPESNLIQYKLTLDKSGIERYITETYNRVEQGQMSTLPAYGDLGHYGPERWVDFPKGYDFSFVLDVGYKTVPADVELATRLLMEDIQCGKLDYFSKYVSSYNTDQFKVQFDKKMLEGTGNMIVDKILDKYTLTISKPGLL